VEVKVWHPRARSVAARMEGVAYVGDKQVAEATVTCQLVDRSRGRQAGTKDSGNASGDDGSEA
jgi:hypothetical protein